MQSRFAIAALAVILTTAIASGQITSPPAAGPALPVIPPGSYIGDQACATCHRAKADTFARTAHRLTSRLASRSSIAGEFSGADATMRTRNPAVWFRMEAKADGFYQTAFRGLAPATTSRSERFDIVTGSARKGQTYLFWKGDALYELPVSYWVDPGHWINSPGFPDGDINFDRQAQPRCLECHATYFQTVAMPNRYDRNNFVLGITCEKCHGPGRSHAASGAPMPAGRANRDGIVNTGRMSRDRQIELCATCHGGPTVRDRVPAFSYRPGEPFDSYFGIGRGAFGPVAASNEVHGNQVGLLKNSRCFQQSEMTCSTCHDVHVTERDVIALSGRCLTCHKVESCKTFPKSGRQIAGKCVDCHMPNQRSAAISVTTTGAPIQPLVRTHLIKVYPPAPGR